MICICRAAFCYDDFLRGVHFIEHGSIRDAIACDVQGGNFASCLQRIGPKFMHIIDDTFADAGMGHKQYIEIRNIAPSLVGSFIQT